MSVQRIFNPVNFHFEWDGDWYKWDAKAGRKAALKARNDEAKRLEQEGYRVSKFSLPGQLSRRGGVGSGHPDVEFVVNCYGLNAYKI